MTDQEIEAKKLETIVERVRKLLNLAAKNPNAEEAASAAAKAQALLESYNLTMATIEQGGGEGKREEARRLGGMYIYERELWRAIADLNFCMYFTTRTKGREGTKRKISFQHRIIGRVVNTTGTRIMADYLHGAIERLCRERFPINSQFFCREAVAFREGMSDNLTARLYKRRRKIDEEQAAKKAKATNMAGHNTAFALTIADVKDAEEAGNYDFIHGEGAWARKEARQAQAEENWNKRRAEQAKAEAEAEAEYAAWAEANPEEAAKEAEKERKRQRTKDNRYSRRSYRERAPSAREKRQSTNYYDDGHSTADKISLDRQMGDHSNQKRITAK